MYEHWTYRDYLRDVVRALATAWVRDGGVMGDLRCGVAALGRCLMRLIAPMLIPLAPIVALIVRASDRRDVREFEKARQEVEKARQEARRRIHQWGPGDDQ